MVRTYPTNDFGPGTVDGDLRVTNNLTVGGSIYTSGLSVSGNLSVGGNLSVTGSTIESDDLIVLGDMVTSGNLLFKGGSVVGFINASGTQFQGNLITAVSGTITDISGTNLTYGNAIIGSLIGDVSGTSVAATSISGITVNAVTVFVTKTTGSVLIIENTDTSDAVKGEVITMNSPNVNAIGHEIIYPNGTIGAGLYIHSVDLQNVAIFGGAGSATNGQNRILRNRPAGSTASEVFRVDQQNVDDDQPTFVAIQAASTYPAIVSSGNLIVTGDLGIGTSTPGTKVEISTAATNLGTLTVASDYMGAGAFGMISAFKRKGASGVTVNDEAGIVFEHKDTNGSRQEYASIFGGVENTTIGSESGYITFETTLSGTTRGERIRITADGDIGIGTTAPEEKVVVSGGKLLSKGAGTHAHYQFEGATGSFTLAAGDFWMDSTGSMLRFRGGDGITYALTLGSIANE